ncbi:hypothetical protein [Propionivibrio sp.]|uniref:hypothetical protein n=1 Tax=Propionivibrio sp. TaxID=2212460 RepID=UPI003BF09694
MRPLYSPATEFFDAGRKLARMRAEVRYWLNAGASRDADHVASMGLFYRLMTQHYRAFRRELISASK